MRKIVLATVLAVSVPVMGATVVGCGSSWWQSFISNPSSQAQSFETGVQIALNDAQIAWVFAQPFIPAAALAQVTTQYNNAVYLVDHALQALNDAVTAAANLHNSNPDFTALMVTVTDAVNQVLGIIHQYMQPAPVADAAVAANVTGPAKAPAHPALSEAQTIVDGLVATYHLTHGDAGAH